MMQSIKKQIRLSLGDCGIGLGVTAGCVVFGLIFNCALGMGVWDYSRVPLNLWGQICLPFTLIWLGFSFLLFRFVIPNDPLI